MLSTKDLFRYRGGLDKAMPAKGGEKAFMPDGSWLQEKCIESFNKERERVLSEPRVVRSMDIAKGEWKPEFGLLELVHEMKNFFEHMGFNDNKRKWLYPEEALFLLETGVLEIWYLGLPLSIQEAYSILIIDKIQLDYYQVYSHLRRIGYVVLRHQGRYNFSKYERKIRLDKHVSRKRKKNKKGQDEKESSDQFVDDSKTEDVSKNTISVDSVNNSGNAIEDSSVFMGSQRGNQSGLQTADNQSESKITKTSQESQMAENNPECDERQNRENMKSVGENICYKSDILSCVNMATPNSTHQGETSLSQEDQSDEMLENEEMDIEETMQARSNFADIEFPNFKSTSDKVLVSCPNVKYIPQGPDVSFNDCVYSFDKKLFINTKKIKKKQQLLDDALVQELDFSYPDIMTGWFKVKKSCSNWKQYKLAVQKEKSMRDRSAVFPHLYGGKVKPLVQPENAKSTYAVLDQLNVVKDDEMKKCDTVPDNLPQFDVYSPNSTFKKTKPGIPDFRVKIVRSSDPVPGLKEVNTICSYLNDEASLHWAIVDCGNIIFYNMADLPLPQDISLG